MAINKLEKRLKIKRRVRSKVSGTPEQPRLTVFRSNTNITAQIIDDTTGKTLVSTASLIKEIAEQKVNKVEQAKLVGAKLAEKAKAANVTKVVFDRNGYLYHGRVKALADAARENGLQF